MKLDENKQRTDDGAPASRRPFVVDEAMIAKSSAKSMKRRTSKACVKADSDDINSETQKAIDAVEEKMDAWTFIRTVRRPENLPIHDNTESAESATAHDTGNTPRLTSATHMSMAEAATKEESSPSASTTALVEGSGNGLSRASATTKSGKRRSVMAWIGAKANGARTPASTPTEEATLAAAAPSSAALMAAAASTIATSCAAAKAPSSLKLKAFQNARQITFHSLEQFDGSGGAADAAATTPAALTQLRQHSAHATTAFCSSEPVFGEILRGVQFDSPAVSDALDAGGRRRNHPSSGGGSASGDHASGVPPSSTTAISASSSLSSLRSLKNCFVKNRSSIYSATTTAEAVDDSENSATKTTTIDSQERNVVNRGAVSGPLNKSASTDDATTPFMS